MVMLGEIRLIGLILLDYVVSLIFIITINMVVQDGLQIDGLLGRIYQIKKRKMLSTQRAHYIHMMIKICVTCVMTNAMVNAV